MAKRRKHGTVERVHLGSCLEEVDTTTWIEVDESSLSPERRKMFLARKAGLVAFLAGSSYAEIKVVSGVSGQQIYQLLTERCLQSDSDGNLSGWRGLIPHRRMKTYTRQAKLKPDQWGNGLSGALQLLFSTEGGHALRTSFEKRILHKLQYSLEGRKRQKKDLVFWFLDEAKKLFQNYQEHWPFNTQRQGQTTISKYIDTVLEREKTAGVEFYGGPEAVKKAKAGQGQNRPNFSLFDRVEFDAHMLDLRCVVMVPNPSGGWEPRLIHRLWVLISMQT